MQKDKDAIHNISIEIEKMKAEGRPSEILAWAERESKAMQEYGPKIGLTIFK